jgi:hypothetical protein
MQKGLHLITTKFLKVLISLIGTAMDCKTFACNVNVACAIGYLLNQISLFNCNKYELTKLVNIFENIF